MEKLLNALTCDDFRHALLAEGHEEELEGLDVRVNTPTPEMTNKDFFKYMNMQTKMGTIVKAIGTRL